LRRIERLLKKLNIYTFEPSEATTTRNSTSRSSGEIEEKRVAMVMAMADSLVEEYIRNFTLFDPFFLFPSSFFFFTIVCYRISYPLQRLQQRAIRFLQSPSPLVVFSSLRFLRHFAKDTTVTSAVLPLSYISFPLIQESELAGAKKKTKEESETEEEEMRGLFGLFDAVEEEKSIVEGEDAKQSELSDTAYDRIVSQYSCPTKKPKSVPQKATLIFPGMPNVELISNKLPQPTPEDCINDILSKNKAADFSRAYARARILYGTDTVQNCANWTSVQLAALSFQTYPSIPKDITVRLLFF